ncbi:MAG: diacylglycerol kinase family protein [Pseudanabaenaceae cyanobacterium bins.68]|nr:diacylglycerol kinase family protein [Pseudanabaenaceae cyanobacterium bins.68]
MEPVTRLRLKPLKLGQFAVSRRPESFAVASSLSNSLWYAWAGVSYAFTTQRNFRIHLVIASLALSLDIHLRLSMVETAIICLTIGAVLVMELLNTALEAVVDLSVGQTYHLLAKIAKDCAAGAVLVSAVVAVVVGGCLIWPPLALEINQTIVAIWS